MSSRPFVVPQPLAPGSHIRVISPGLPTLGHLRERGRRAEQVLRGLGFDVSYGAHAFSISEDGLFAGTAQERAADFMEAFEDPSVDAILTSDSGHGSRELLPFLDATKLAANVKPFIGYCDTAWLHQYLALEAGMSSIYGCVLMIHIAEGGGPFPETLEYFQHLLTRPTPLVCRSFPSRTNEKIHFYVPDLEARRRARTIEGGWTWLRRGRGCGRLVGGEISLVPELVRGFGLSLRSSVLFWDIGVGSPPEAARPNFEALVACADLSKLSGMIVGLHPKIAPPLWAAEVGGWLGELLPDAQFPVVVNADLSHLGPSWFVPYGEQAILDDAEGIVFPRTATPAARCYC